MAFRHSVRRTPITQRGAAKLSHYPGQAPDRSVSLVAPALGYHEELPELALWQRCCETLCDSRSGSRPARQRTGGRCGAEGHGRGAKIRGASDFVAGGAVFRALRRGLLRECNLYAATGAGGALQPHARTGGDAGRRVHAGFGRDATLLRHGVGPSAFAAVCDSRRACNRHFPLQPGDGARIQDATRDRVSGRVGRRLVSSAEHVTSDATGGSTARGGRGHVYHFWHDRAVVRTDLLFDAGRSAGRRVDVGRGGPGPGGRGVSHLALACSLGLGRRDQAFA